MSSSQINRIHVNSSTNMTLNARFTAMQSTGPQVTNSIAKKIAQRRATNDGLPGKASLANRKFLQRLEQKHKIQAALKLKRRSLRTRMPSRQRIRTRIGLKKGAAKAIRLTPNGKLIRSNSLSNIATMKADLVGPASLKRSDSASNLALRLGSRRPRIRRGGGGGPSQLPRRQLKRSASKQRITARSRSRSVSNLRRANSKTNLRNTNNKGNLKAVRGREAPPQKRINRNQIRSASRQRKRSSSVSGRLGRPNMSISRRRLSQNGIANGNNSQGRAPFRRRNSTGNVGNKSGAKQGRVSRPRGRGNTLQQQRGRSRSRSRIRNKSSGQGNGRQGGGRGSGGARGNQQRGRGRGQSRVRGRQGRGPRTELKKEDLDKELDQYMANTKTALDKDLDVYMSGNTV